MRRETPKIELSAFKEAVSRLCSQSFFIIDFDAHKVLFQSERMIYIDDATKKDIKGEYENPYFSLVSEDTLVMFSHLRKAYRYIGDFLSEDDYRNHISITHFPIVLRDNEIFISQRFTPLSINDNGNIKTGMFAVSPSTGKSMGNLILTPSGKRFRFSFEEGVFYEYNLNKDLTVMEKAIIQNSRMGMSTEEVADNLGISVNTVKTHKKKIFRKLEVNSLTELLSFVGEQQLL